MKLLVNAIQGRRSLAETVWFWGLLPFALLRAALELGFYAAGKERVYAAVGFDTITWVLDVSVIIFLAVAILSGRAIWLCARRYSGRAVWMYCAYLVAIVIVLVAGQQALGRASRDANPAVEMLANQSAGRDGVRYQNSRLVFEIPQETGADPAEDPVQVWTENGEQICVEMEMFVSSGALDAVVFTGIPRTDEANPAAELVVPCIEGIR